MATTARYNVFFRNAPRTAMKYCHPHNLVQPEKAAADRRYGIRIRLPEGDTFTRLLGEDWQQERWYSSEEERDRAYEQIAVRHGYYRTTDTPTQVLEKIVR